MLKNYFFQMSVNTREMWSNGIKIAFSFQKLTKIAQRLGALPQIPIANGRWGLRDTLEYTSLLTHIS